MCTTSRLQWHAHTWMKRWSRSVTTATFLWLQPRLLPRTHLWLHLTALTYVVGAVISPPFNLSALMSSLEETPAFCHNVSQSHMSFSIAQCDEQISFVDDLCIDSSIKVELLHKCVLQNIKSAFSSQLNVYFTQTKVNPNKVCYIGVRTYICLCFCVCMYIYLCICVCKYTQYILSQ